MTELKLTVIGENSGCPQPGGATSCYLLTYGNEHLVLDLGSGALSRLMSAVDFDSVNDIILTHGHADHTADAGVAVYSRLISDQLGRCVSPLHFHLPQPELVMDSDYAVKTLIDENLTEQIGSFSVSYLRTEHPVPTYAVKVTAGGKTVCYTADGALNERLAAFSSRADLLLSECSFYPGKGSRSAGHMRAEDVLQLARQAQPGLLVMTHLPVYGDRKEILSFVKKDWEGSAMLASPLLEVCL